MQRVNFRQFVSVVTWNWVMTMSNLTLTKRFIYIWKTIPWYYPSLTNSILKMEAACSSETLLPTRPQQVDITSEGHTKNQTDCNLIRQNGIYLRLPVATDHSPRIWVQYPDLRHCKAGRLMFHTALRHFTLHRSTLWTAYQNTISEVSFVLYAILTPSNASI
jgi:hypothetical protein